MLKTVRQVFTNLLLIFLAEATLRRVLRLVREQRAGAASGRRPRV